MKIPDPFKLFLERVSDFDTGEHKLCPNCKTLFKKRQKNQMFCSERCRNQVSCRRHYNKTKTTKRASSKRLLNTVAPEMYEMLEQIVYEVAGQGSIKPNTFTATLALMRKARGDEKEKGK